MGIDEAGFGPILGPLVVSSASFAIPDSLLKADLYKLLKPAIGKRKKHLAGRLLITDSKKAYNKSRDLPHLGRTVLSHLACGSNNTKKLPQTTAELLSVVCSDCAARLGEYPWYKSLAENRLDIDADDIHIAAGVLKNALNAQNIRFASLQSICLDVGHYNRMVSAVKNKATVLFTAVCTLIKRSMEGAYKSEILQVIVDRQGGRTAYTRPLMKMFPSLSLQVIREDRKISSYELTSNRQTMRLHFVSKADQLYLPVSLASMTSKYIRELLVKAINSYFINHYSDLKPTAGYWKDGQRFIRDLDSNLRDIKYDRQMLIRSR